MRGHLRAFVILPVLVLLTALGCSTPGNLPTEPRAVQPSDPEVLRSDPAVSPNARGGPRWYIIAQAEVKPGEVKTVGGGRYELCFYPKSLTAKQVITIREYDSHVLDFELLPHGLKFGTPVELRVDFSGTTADPGASIYDGSKPLLYWFNDGTGKWEVIPSTTNWSQLKLKAKLSHFSRYSVRLGKAGW